MGETGFVRFPGSLDPRAEEFRPRNPYSPNQVTLVQPQIYYSYPPPPARPYPPPSEVQVVAFCDGGGVGYPQYASPVTPPAYVSTNPPLPPPLPPPSTMPTRTLLLSSVPTDVSESEVRRELEVYGDVRAVQMESVRDGIVTVHFYDLRHAEAAMVEIRDQHMQQQSRLRRHYDALLTHNSVYELQNLVAPLPPPARGLISGRAVWAQFTIPSAPGVPDGHNQGTLVIFNLDSEVSTSCLKEIFEAFGPVKELRETPLKRHQRFVEFFDVRDASKAIAEMNGKEIHGKNIHIEFSRPGGHGKRFSKSTSPNTVKNFNSIANDPGRNSRRLPPPTPPLPGCSTPSLRPRSYNFQTKKSSFCKGNPNGNCSSNSNASSGTLGGSIASLCLSGVIGNGIDQCNDRPQKKSLKKGQNPSSSSANHYQQQMNKSSRPLKGRHPKDFDPRFLINEDAIMESNCRDSRTTVMIKNIPNKYSQKLLLNMLDNHCIHCNEQLCAGGGEDQPLSSYDFVYLPIDFINKCNVGYGFVNMTSPEATLRLYKAFHLQNWEVFNSKKICEVTYARLQGLEALKEHFKNSKFPCDEDEYLPVVFSPPRDGRQLTEPNPIVGRTTSACLQYPPTASSKDSEADDDDDVVNSNNACIDGGDDDVYSEEEVGDCRSCSTSSSRRLPNDGDDDQEI